MVFPVETEERVRRRALNICQDHLRKVLEITRKVTQMIDSFAANEIKSAHVSFAEIQKLEDEVEVMRRKVLQELAEIGGVLSSREDFLRFVNQTSEIVGYSLGIGFRLLEIMNRGWKGSPQLKNGIVKLSDGMFETVSKLRETTIALNYSSTKALEKAREVGVAEKTVDNLYRELEIKILNSKIEIPVLLLLRDITQLLEEISDKAEDASDAACVLAFVM